MNIKYLIYGIIAFIIGVLFLIWNIKKPLKEDDESLGADDFEIYDGLNRAFQQKGYIVCIGIVVLGLVLIYEGITGGSPFGH